MNNPIKSLFTFFFISLLSGLIGGFIVWGIFTYTYLPQIKKVKSTEISKPSQSPIRNANEGQSTAVKSVLPVAYTTGDVETSRRNAIVISAEKVSPAVVSINAVQTRVVRAYDPFYDPFFDDFFRNFYRDFYREYKERIPSLGSGVIVTRDGYILTNEHVIHNADEITVTLPSGGSYKGKLIGASEVFDLAVVKIDGDNFPFAQMGDSDDLIIGEWAIAIGNPFGNLINDTQPTVTAGVISALNRSFEPEQSEGKAYRGMIQTDASINPGNSGGALANSEGKLIGINTFIFSKGGGSLGIGFAIPINRAKRVMEEIIRYGKVRNVWVGLEVQKLPRDSEIQGILVTKVDSNSPSEKAGIKKGDIITEVGNKRVFGWQDANSAFQGRQVGEEVKVKIYRDKKPMIVKIILEELPSNFK